MGISEREGHRRDFLKLLDDYAITTERAAELLHSSVHRIGSWRRTETARGHHPVPEWAIELLRFKIEQLKLAPAKREGT